MFFWNQQALYIAIILLLILLLYKVLFYFFHQGRIFFPFPNLPTSQQQVYFWQNFLYKALPYIQIFMVAFLLIAFLRPQSSSSLVQLQKEGIAIQVLVDRSSSMRQIMSYNNKKLSRLETVKIVFQDFLLGDEDKLQGRSNDLVGLGTFAGFLEENVPLTLDHFTLIDFLKEIKLAQRYEDGTFIGDALYQSVLRLLSIDQFLSKNSQNYKIKSKIIVLLTDGQHTQGSFPPLEAAKFAKENNIKIYTIAITGQENIKGTGSLLFPVLDTSILKDIAKITNGTFSTATSGESLKAIYEKIDQLEKSKISDSTLIKQELFPFFLKIAFILFLLQLIIRYFLLKKIF